MGAGVSAGRAKTPSGRRFLKMTRTAGLLCACFTNATPLIASRSNRDAVNFPISFLLFPSSFLPFSFLPFSPCHYF